MLVVSLSLFASASAYAESVGCVTTTWKLIGANHKVCLEAFDDPKVPGVICHVSHARTAIALPAKLPEEETVFSEDTSILFKETHIENT